MRLLIVSPNTLPAAPTGPVYVAGAVREAGHEVRIHERLFANDLEGELTSTLDDFKPDVIGVSIRLVFGDGLDMDAPRGKPGDITGINGRIEEGAGRTQKSKVRVQSRTETMSDERQTMNDKR